MKTRLQNLSVALLVLAISTIVIAKPSSFTVNIQNQSSANLGNVQISLYGGGSVYQYVPTYGEYPVNLNVGPTQVVVNSYVTPIGQIGYAITQDGHRLKVDFSSGSLIVVQDQSVMQ